MKKREGYRHICSFDDGIRAIWTGEIDGEIACFVISGGTLYRVDPQLGDYCAVGRLGTSQNQADMFYYRNNLYLIDGEGLYKIDHNGLTKPFGYVPLIGKDWNDYVGGEPYEPRNLLNDKGRISYISTENASSILRLDGEVSSIDAVFVNGVPVSTERYGLNSAKTVLNISGLKNGDRTVVYFTYPSEASGSQELLKNTRATVFGGISNSRPFLYGGTDRSVMYSAAYVSPTSLEQSRKVYPQSDALYFPQGYEFCVGDGRYPVRALCRHYDRLLIFTAGEAWMANSSSCGTDDFPVMSINSAVGVKSDKGAAMLENFPYTVGNGGVFRWTSDTDELNDCNAYRISEPIEELLPTEFFDKACVFANRNKREILFSCPELSLRTWVYSVATSSWTSFSGIEADMFFELGSKLGFVRMGALYVFDDKLTNDDGKEITAEFISGNISFDTNEKKHLSELSLISERGDVQVCVYKDGSSIPAVTHNFYADSKCTMGKKRLRVGRADYATVSITAPSQSRQIIHALCISAVK